MTTPPQLQWLCLPFSALSTLQLYQVLRLRARVFIIEQNCAYQDIDDLDQPALHLLGQTASQAKAGTKDEANNGTGVPVTQELLAYARLLPPGVKYSEPSIGRVVSSPAVRGQQIGRALMREAISRCESTWPGLNIRISAQHHLEAFYRRAGFTRASEPYMEDDIAHIEMLRHACE